jgi:hypothetical protein
MSERGSFVTEYIYCDKCFASAKTVLLEDCKYLRGVTIPMWGVRDGELPIIAGKVGGTYSGEEVSDFEHHYVPALEKVLCHEMRIAVLAEVGQRIFTVIPDKAGKE